MTRQVMLALCCLGVTLPAFGAGEGKTLYCSPRGQDAPGRGAEKTPLKTINYALTQVGKAGGATVVLLDGAHRQPSSGWAFDKPVVIRAQNKHRAVIERLFLHRAKNLVIDGLTIDRKSAGRAVNVLHIAGWSSYCIVRNCRITHGAGGHQNTDAVKINQGAHHILIEDNEVFDGTDEEIDTLQDVHDVVVRRNIVYQYRIKEKDQALISNKRRAYRMMYEGNLLANLNPESSNGALRFGGSVKGGEECHTMVALGNLFVNTTGRGAMTFGGAKKCLVANNIFVNHNDRRTGAITIYSNHPRGDLANDELYVVHNILYNVTGPRRRPVFSFPPKNQAAFPKKWHFSHNLYFNPVQAVPKNGVHNPHTETGAMFKDPLFVGDLGKLTGRPTPEWFEILKLQKDSPFLKDAPDLMKLPLPKELKTFLKDYRGEGKDPWYKQINTK